MSQRSKNAMCSPIMFAFRLRSTLGQVLARVLGRPLFSEVLGAVLR